MMPPKRKKRKKKSQLRWKVEKEDGAGCVQVPCVYYFLAYLVPGYFFEIKWMKEDVITV